MAESRRRVSRGSQEESAGHSNGFGGRNRTERVADTGDEDEGAGPSGIHEDDDDPARRREIRSQYRDLINSVHQNREDMLNPANNKLIDVLEEANKLFANVRQAREAALDAQLLVLATDLGREKASQLHAEGSSFDPSAYAQHLLSFMGLNRLEEEDGNEDDCSDGYLPPDAWQRLSKRVESCFKTAPSFHYMLGSFLVEPPPPRQRIERQRKAPSKEAKRVMPIQLKKMEESHQEATEKEVERILGFLNKYYADNSESPIPYYDFVIDPTSFSRTVENIFHTSFLIRDGLARIYLDSEKLPCIVPVEEGEVEPGGATTRQQCIISISQASWKEIIKAFDIKDGLIPPPEEPSQEDRQE
ncbi:non-structural maintenance of chromosomes element 4 homolog A [Electrophorus electricus]|uniref:Non-structural maintenance of chromosomes element 4 n=1 Tax=Electrophorus electricus TaxID=8005 RepID=A0A4W4HEX9_ELEEL|nr:non-structural maintenance of chromosomes element 4 homolog A [Electrophorus electricus]XP_026885383.1 non-structural maintenance of chromosomes element 4 homolog A [Electrophorus electricus]